MNIETDWDEKHSQELSEAALAAANVFLCPPSQLPSSVGTDHSLAQAGGQ
jgi:hypothetical protein